MQSDNLVVLDGRVIVLVPLTVRDVHEEATRERFTNVVIVRFVFKRSRHEVPEATRLGFGL